MSHRYHVDKHDNIDYEGRVLWRVALGILWFFTITFWVLAFVFPDSGVANPALAFSFLVTIVTACWIALRAAGRRRARWNERTRGFEKLDED